MLDIVRHSRQDGTHPRVGLLLLVARTVCKSSPAFRSASCNEAHSEQGHAVRGRTRSFRSASRTCFLTAGWPDLGARPRVGTWGTRDKGQTPARKLSSQTMMLYPNRLHFIVDDMLLQGWRAAARNQHVRCD
ncbi:hypothetical protein SUNI508_02644 [Seiridium unicorne]|uniref:Uncharacterized protein n=1 Tax=Seiridium unicorne TaxID=138068 RepID=A0ABR2UG56_9PEZI